MDTLTPKIVQARAILQQAVKEHKPAEMFGLFSGGYDSLVIAHLMWRFSENTGTAHLNTGIGIPETRTYVRETCASRNWSLAEYTTPEKYEDLVLERGFPGPGHHWKMYCRLKDRSVDELIRDNKSKWRDRILLVTGIRNEESIKRMGYTEPIQRRGAQVWVNPILGWSKIDVHAYKARYELPDNLVVDLLHGSKECLCGAYAHKGELKEIELWYPKTGAYLRDLERRVREAGHNWGWEEAPPKKADPRQGNFFMPLCVGCENRPNV